MFKTMSEQVIEAFSSSGSLSTLHEHFTVSHDSYIDYILERSLPQVPVNVRLRSNDA